MNCPECQQANPDDALFCLACGRSLRGVCPACGADLPAEARFCLRCGHELAVPMVPDLGAKPPMRDERRLVTVLFADVVGSTSLAARLDAEDWKAVINGAFATLTTPITRYQGSIAQFLGDGFLAFFGAPVAHEDDAQRAVRAALELIEAARRYADEVRERFGAEFAVRVGINTGPVVVGAVGTDQRNEYLAVGETVNVAARLQTGAAPMTALISDSTRRLLPDGFELDDAGLVEVRGLDEPIRAFIPRRAPADTERGARSLPFASPMVGRTRELDQLASATAATRAGIGRIVVLLGEPGIGKSRLLREWRALATESGTRWAQASMPAHAAGVAYHLAGEAVRAMLGLGADAGPAELDATLESTGVAGELDARGYLADLLSIPLPDRGVADAHPLSPQGRQARYIELTLAVARAVTSDPLVLVLNDAHWSDPSSIALLTPLIALHARRPLLVCITARPDPDTGGWRLVQAARGLAGAGIVEISLESLPLADTMELLKNLLDADELPDGLADFVNRRAEGNPLFVEEVVRMLVDRELLARADGWQFDGGRIDQIPETLQALLAARIDRLDAEARTALRVASVIGRRFSVPVLERLLGPAP